MARKTTTVSIADEKSRDHGKLYVLTEMPASQAEKWAVRAFLALARSGVDIPADVRDSGMAGLAMMGFQMLGRMEFTDAEVLMDEMMGCVAVIPDRNNSFSRRLVEDDIEEVATRLRLRSEVFTLHTGFSLADVPSMFNSATAPASPDTQTSQPSSER